MMTLISYHHLSLLRKWQYFFIIVFILFEGCYDYRLFAQISIQIHKDQFQIKNLTSYVLKDLKLYEINLADSIEAGYQPSRSPIWIELEAVDQLKPIQDLQQLSPESVWSGVLNENRFSFKFESKGDVYREIQSLQKKQSEFEQAQQKKFLIQASFDLKDWPKALTQLALVKFENNQLHWDFARLHLQTAGAVILKNEISPYLSAQAHALKKITTDELKPLLLLKEDVPLRLIAYACRYFDESLVDFQVLLNRFSPIFDQAPPQDFNFYDLLATPSKSLKTTLELKGSKIILELIKHERWANALDLDQPLLLWVLAKNEVHLDEAEILKAFAYRQNEHQSPMKQMIAMFRNQPFEQMAYRWIDALMNQTLSDVHISKEDFQRQQKIELTQATQLAVLLREKQIKLPLSDLSRKLCVIFDQQIQQVLEKGNLLSAQGYLLLSADLCHGSNDYFQRVGAFFRKKAELALSEHDLSNAQTFYKSAWLVAAQTEDLYMLLEILSKISIIYASKNQSVEARYFLNEARTLFENQVVVGPFFEVAQKQFPKADFKAKLALLLIIIVIAYFSITRILKVIYDR
jgi:hypothetical protein